MNALDQISAGASTFLGEKWATLVEVKAIQKIFGGASRETYRLHLAVAGETLGIILRRDPPSSLIDTERQLEFGAYARIFGSDVPVPEPLFLENEGAYLERPFSIMAAIDDCQTDVSVLKPEQRKRVGRQKYEILGRLAAKDPVALGFDEIMPVPRPDECALQQLSYWESVILADQLHPQPVAQAAVRWLKGNLPQAAQKIAVVHGDYRSGNFLYDANADITGILDWEMAHLGDPLEDLAWSMDPLWRGEDVDLAGRLLPDEQAIAIWEESSGLTCDRDDLRWWRIFVAVKGIAIWISSTEDHERGEGKDSILAMAGWVMTDRQNKILLNYVAPGAVT